ncbi:MAG: hypothetical protein OEX05_03380 [Chloroflexota bacterium]|nr:hypothetical protein [Chloroflexota bacterium]
MIPLIPILAGLVLFLAGFAILRTFGPRYRVGRLLAATPIVSIAQALALADDAARYVGIRGRIDSENEFEDELHRPLVLRRTRIQQRPGSDWETVDEQLDVVDFDVREGLDAIAVDHAALDVGLIVVPRESIGTAADVPDRVPGEIAPETPVRLRVDLVSAVEHAIVLGVPTRRDGDDRPTMSAGLGRPLILSTLEPSEAMRVLAEDHERRPLAAAIAFVAGALLLAAGLLWAALGAVTGTAAAASPVPTAAVGGDPRSSGAGPGLVGEPLLAIGLVIALGVLATVATLAYVRFTGGRRA